jgi:hypothetical protein
MVVSTLGDPFMNGYFDRPSIPWSFLKVARCSDLITMTSMGGLAGEVVRHSAAPVMLLPHGVCQVRFQSFHCQAACSNDQDYDVVFIGSRNVSRNPFRPNARMGRTRTRLVEALGRRFGPRFAVFGRGWEGLPWCLGSVQFDQQALAASRGQVVVGGIPFSHERYYCSDRPFIQITSGSVLVDSAVPGVDRILGDRRHWVLAPEDRIVQTVEDVLEWDESKRRAVGEAGADCVWRHHTQAHRVSTLLENVRRLRAIREKGITARPFLPFFLPEVDVCEEERFAVRQWPC